MPPASGIVLWVMRRRGLPMSEAMLAVNAIESSADSMLSPRARCHKSPRNKGKGKGLGMSMEGARFASPPVTLLVRLALQTALIVTDIRTFPAPTAS